MKLVDVLGLHLEASSGAPIVVLQEHDAPHRLLPIFVGGSEATAIAIALSGQAPPRPLTHDVMAELFLSLGGHLDAVEVTEVRDGAFLAELAVTGPHGDQRLEARPSDGIALAVRLGTPLFVSEDVLDVAGTGPLGGPDEIDAFDELDDDIDDIDDESIDEAVAEFRSFLDTLDPTDFADHADGGEGDPPTLP